METFAQLAGIAVVAAIAIFAPVTYLMSKLPSRAARQPDPLDIELAR